MSFLVPREEDKQVRVLRSWAKREHLVYHNAPCNKYYVYGSYLDNGPSQEAANVLALGTVTRGRRGLDKQMGHPEAAPKAYSGKQSCLYLLHQDA
jgi:hypothetical protein